MQGEVGAKSYPVAPGNTMLLMDSEQECFYIKQTDASGMPMPLRTFDYTERVPVQAKPFDASAYVTKEELEAKLAELKGEAHE